MEEEYAFSVRPGHDSRSRMAQSDGSVAARSDQVSLKKAVRHDYKPKTDFLFRFYK